MQFTTPRAPVHARARREVFDRAVRDGKPDQTTAHDVSPRTDGRILCVHCGNPVARETDRICQQGHHTHTFTNPGGIVFRIGCFSDVRNCLAPGEATARYSWFPEFLWQVLVCRKCGSHLGWVFSRADRHFFTLILDRVTR